MNRLCQILAMTASLLVCGCASREVRSGAEPSTIVVYVDGAVNKPGKYQLGEPFTIQHAIKQAGGLDRFEEGQNDRVLVKSHAGETQKVRSRDYTSFRLKDGDIVVIPRF